MCPTVGKGGKRDLVHNTCWYRLERLGLSGMIGSLPLCEPHPFVNLLEEDLNQTFPFSPIVRFRQKIFIPYKPSLLLHSPQTGYLVLSSLLR